jgi:3-methyladenine DNA glycosylase AlkD
VREIVSQLQALPVRNTESLRRLRREWSRRLATATAPDVIKLALRLLRHARSGVRFMAYELVSHHRAALASVRARDLLHLGQGISSWDAVDMFGCFLAGPVWRERQVPDRLIHRWARLPDHWWRRAALVSTVPLNCKARGGKGDASRTLAVCRLLAGDRDDMVVKALSWALRGLAKRHPEEVQGFLAEQQGALAARVVREVGNKLSTGLKNPRGRSRK